jgi:hypothetical protein
MPRQKFLSFSRYQFFISKRLIGSPFETRKPSMALTPLSFSAGKNSGRKKRREDRTLSLTGSKRFFLFSI